MELLQTYADAHDRLDSVHSSEIEDSWKAFHKSEGYFTHVIAGRRTGKTTNLLEKAMNSERDSIIFVGHVMQKGMYENLLDRKCFDGIGYRLKMNSNTRCVYEKPDNCLIEVQTVSNELLLLGLSFLGKDLFFDEFNAYKTFGRHTESWCHGANSLSIASSLQIGDNSEQETIFTTADKKIIIDSKKSLINKIKEDRFEMMAELVPSEFVSL